MRKSKVAVAGLFNMAKLFIITGIDPISDDAVVPIAESLGVSKEEYLAALKAEKPDTLKSLLDKAKTGRTVFTADEFTRFKENHRGEVTAEMVTLAKSQKLPKELYDVVKGSVLEQTERDAAKKHGITKWESHDDLIEQIRSKAGNSTEAEKRLNALQAEHDQLKAVNQRLAQEKEEAAGLASKEVHKLKIATAKESAISGVTFDVAEDKVVNQQGILRSLVESKYDFAVVNDKIVALEKGTDKPVKNPVTLDAVPISELYIQVAKDYALPLKSPEQGGRGTGSSSQTDDVTTMSKDQLLAYLKAKGIENKNEGAILFNKWKVAHPNEK